MKLLKLLISTYAGRTITVVIAGYNNQPARRQIYVAEKAGEEAASLFKVL
jgi:hypothetical protein